MDVLHLVQHYLSYLQSPPVLLAILIVVGPIVLEVFKNKVLSRGPPTTEAEDCFKLGTSRRTNSTVQDKTMGKTRIKALFTYPIKSCRGIELAASEVGPTGLKYDRLLTFAQLVSKPDKVDNANANEINEVSGDWKHQWRFITQREFPRLSLLKTELWVPSPEAVSKDVAKDKVSNQARHSEGTDRNMPTAQTSPSPAAVKTLDQEADESWSANGGCLVIRFAFEPDFNLFGLRTDYITIRLPVRPTPQRAESKKYSYETLSIWKDFPTATNISNEIPRDDLAKLKYFLGVSNPLALFRVEDSNYRAVTRNLPKDRQPDENYSVGFADAFPLHMLSLASVQVLDDELPEKARPMKGRLDPRRFRANIYITGAAAYEEDRWKRIAAGRGMNVRSKDRKVVEKAGEYHVACRTARCKLPNVHQETGVNDANEPYTTLGRTRKVDEGAYPHPCLGMHMIPLFQQGILKVGDEIKVLERGEHYYEKMFS